MLLTLVVATVLAQTAVGPPQAQKSTRVLLDDKPVVVSIDVQADPEMELRKRLSAQPDDVGTMLDLAKVLRERKKLDEATALVTVALERLRRELAAQGRVSLDPPPVVQLPPGRSVQGTPVRVGSSIREPRKLKDVKPTYPPEAQRAGISGIVIIEVLIDVDGTVADAKVLRGQPALQASAIDAVRQWEYEPTLLNGVAVPVVMTVTVTYRLG